MCFTEQTTTAEGDTVMCGVIPEDKYEVSSYTWIHIDLDLQSYIKTIPVTSTYSEQHFCDKIMWCGDRERKTSEEQKVHAAKFLEHNKAAYTKDDQPKIQSWRPWNAMHF